MHNLLINLPWGYRLTLLLIVRMMNIKYITLQSQRVEFITTNNNYTGNGMTMSTVAVECYFH